MEDSTAVHQHAKIWLKPGRDIGTEANGACGEVYEVHVVWEWDGECQRENGAATPEEVKYRCAIWRADSREGPGKENVLAINGVVHRQQNQLLVH